MNEIQDPTSPEQPEQAWAPPPPPAPPAPRQKRWPWVAIGCVVVIVAGVLGVFALGSSATKAADTITVTYSITLMDATCTHVFEDFDGYSDIDVGTEVEVFDGAGNLLGFGSLGVCEGTSTTYRAEFPAKVSPDDTYRVTAGNDNRGFLNFTDQDVNDGGLWVIATLG